jgi:3'-phosphoadenosine 5'-phosphosulfate sulfotransferase (PAPS reductase)/FAD synthetase
MKLKKLRVLSLGAGVQSSALALMIQKGEIPMVDCAIFADTGAEPKEVYDWLDWLRDELWFPVYVAKFSNLKEDVINSTIDKKKFAGIPYFMKNSKTGKTTLMKRQCTADYKIKPVNQKVRAILGYQKGEKVSKDTKVEMLMGISYDEMQRMKINPIKYIENKYPLVEKAIRRHNCIQWMEKNNYPKPPRSACTFCPFHSNEEWRRVKENKEEWNEVVKLDKLLRNSSQLREYDEVYLHQSCVPLEKADLREKDEQTGQYSLLDECEGMCGI